MTIGEHAYFSSNTATQAGSAIYNVGSNKKIEIGKNAVFDNNQTTSQASMSTWIYGAIYNRQSTMTISQGAIFSTNTVTADPGTSVTAAGGAIANDKGAYMEIGVGDDEDLKTQFIYNKTDKGGAIDNYDGAKIKIGNKAEFLENTANDMGGAIYNEKNANLTIGSNAKFSTNTANDIGGAIYNNDNARIEIGDNANFEHNTALNGGAIYNTNNARIVIHDDVNFTSNTATNTSLSKPLLI